MFLLDSFTQNLSLLHDKKRRLGSSFRWGSVTAYALRVYPLLYDVMSILISLCRSLIVLVHLCAPASDGMSADDLY